MVVNNVGIAGPTAALEDIEPEDWKHTLNVDLNGFFYVSRRSAPLLKASSGCMVNIASTAALFGFPLRSPYVAAKWAMIGLTKTWAMELGPFGVRVNAICPGSVNGPRIESVIANDATNSKRCQSCRDFKYFLFSSIWISFYLSKINSTYSPVILFKTLLKSSIYIIIYSLN